MRTTYTLLLLLPVLFIVSCGPEPVEQENTVSEKIPMKKILVGTYTKKEGHVNGKAEGIYTFSFRPDSAQLVLKQTNPGSINPSFLTISADKKNVYAVNETGSDVDRVAYVQSYQLNDSTGVLRLLNKQQTAAFAPCYVSMDNEDQYVFVANYVGGIIAVYPRAEDGSLEAPSQVIQLDGQGPHPEQESSHPHAILTSPDNRYVYVPDKGADKIFQFKLENGKLIPTETVYTTVQAGAGPRHLTFHPSLPYAYLINELNATVNVYRYQSDNGSLEFLQTISTLPETHSGFNACADIHITPDGQYLYASNRGHNSITMYKVNPEDGLLKLIGHESTRGITPRNFMIDQSGQWLLVANQDSDNITVFKIAPASGGLIFRHEVACKTPVCLKEY